MTTRIEVDFNDRDDEGLIPANPADATGPLRRGAWVDAFDDEGYRCLATVTGLTTNRVTIQPNWNTFVEPTESRVVVPGASYSGPLSVSVYLASAVPNRRQRRAVHGR
jgi:hypothetical protein